MYIILTTRPSAKHTLVCVCQPRVDKHIEIVGFTEEERVKYITEAFSKEPELIMNFLKYMFLVPHIKSMMYIPLNCAIIAQVYFESQQSSHNNAIPRTRTQLYKALTHSLLVRHMNLKEGSHNYLSMLPEGLKRDDMEKFKILAKFAFDSYHSAKSKKVTFFKEDIPEGLVHFGFMKESTEMYASKGVEQTFSFLHLSLQEYLAAWHLAFCYSTDFHVSYSVLAIQSCQRKHHIVVPKCSNAREKNILSSLESLGDTLVEPALFLSGITGYECQSEDDRRRWELFLSRDSVGCRDNNVLLGSLYEAQNPNILSHIFISECSRNCFALGYFRSDMCLVSAIFPCTATFISTPYHSYALSYCLANSLVPFKLFIGDTDQDQVSVIETFMKGLEGHLPLVKYLEVYLNRASEENAKKDMFWLLKGNFLKTVEEVNFKPILLDVDLSRLFIQSLVNVQKLVIHSSIIRSWESLSALRFLKNLKALHVCELYIACHVMMCTTLTNLNEVVLDVNLPSNPKFDICCTADTLIDSLLGLVLKSNQITKVLLPNVSRKTMSSVHAILLHCPSVVTLELKRARLGYNGILYICSALRKNKTLRHLLIHDSPDAPPLRNARCYGDIQFASFSSMERVALPETVTCTDFLLEVNSILKENSTLEKVDIQSGSFLPLSAEAHREYHQWTECGPLQQFNVGAVGCDRPALLRRSLSFSDLPRSQTLLFWDKHFDNGMDTFEIDFNSLFSKKKEKGKKSFSLPSFTAPDTKILQSFSGLDPRLQKCLGISHFHQCRYVKRIRDTYLGMIEEVSVHILRF